MIGDIAVLKNNEICIFIVLDHEAPKNHFDFHKK